MAGIIEEKIRLSWSDLTKTEQNISDIFIKKKIDITKHSISSLAEVLGTNASTINRWSKALGYEGFKSMISQIKFQDKTSLKYGEDFSTIQKDIIYSISTTEYFVSYKDMGVLAKKILKIHNIILYGEGFGFILCEYYAYMFNKLGIEARTINVSSDLSLIHNPGSVVNLFVSFSGTNPNIKRAFERVKLLDPSCFTAIVSTNPRSNLNGETNVALTSQFHQSIDMPPFELPLIVKTSIDYVFQKLIMMIYENDDLPYKKILNQIKKRQL